jgi:hypothetical protein
MSPWLARRRNGLIESDRIYVRNHDLHALFKKPCSKRKADPARAAGYYCNTSLETVHRLLS